LIAGRITREIATSEFIARHLERPPDAVVVSGVPPSACLWRPTNRVVLVLQRLEREKDTATAVSAWMQSGLADQGWSLRIVGDGSQRDTLERSVSSQSMSGVTFTGWTSDVPGEFRHAGMLLASAPAEPLGLSVIEAMAAGVPVVAAAFGGHLETVGLVANAPLFPPGDASAAAEALRLLLSDPTRARLSVEGVRVVAERFDIARHVDRLLTQYAAACTGAPRGRTGRVSEEER
jgi:glycosyltransferase involved in cell wall biosynthesis